MDEYEYDKFFTYYYQTQPDGDAVLEALEYFIKYVSHIDYIDINMFIQFFSRIGELKPDIIRDYETYFSHSREGRQFIFSVLQNIGDPHTYKFIQKCLNEDEFKEEHSALKESLNNWAPRVLNVFNHPIKSPLDLDILWAEFIITGNTQSIVRIIDVLEWPDMVRTKLNDWLQSKSRIQFIFNLYRKLIAKRLNNFDIILEDNLEKILSTQDMDCFFGIDQSGSINQKKFNELKSLLPFN